MHYDNSSLQNVYAYMDQFNDLDPGWMGDGMGHVREDAMRNGKKFIGAYYRTSGQYKRLPSLVYPTYDNGLCVEYRTRAHGILASVEVDFFSEKESIKVFACCEPIALVDNKEPHSVADKGKQGMHVFTKDYLYTEHDKKQLMNDVMLMLDEWFGNWIVVKHMTW